MSHEIGRPSIQTIQMPVKLHYTTE